MLLVKGLRQIVQVVDDATAFLRGNDMRKIRILESPQSDLCILSQDGIISYVGPSNGLPILSPTCVEVDAQNGCAIPSFVDAHTHPVFAGDRVHEFAMKLAGATYNEVQASGGGIHFTTRRTREASKEELLESFELICKRMIHSGTTTIEAKSGYGLDEETEMKMLYVLEEAAKKGPLEISSTFCGAHAVPIGSDEKAQTELILNTIIPRIEREKAEGQLDSLQNIDVFCEKGNFGVETTEKILRAGQAIGLHANFHAEELSHIGGTEMGSRIGARAMSHLEHVSDSDIDSMSLSLSTAVLLPSTAFILRLQPPPVRKMIDKGVIVALGSDFNPNAHCLAMPVIMSLACVTMFMSMEEALVAATLNAAHSIGRGTTHGAIGVGRVCDVLVLKSSRWENLIYDIGGHAHQITKVIKRGKIVLEK